MLSDPTEYQLRSAVHVAKLIDAHGNSHDDVRSSYRTSVTQGAHPPAALRDAEELLLDAGLLVLVDSRLLVHERLQEFASIETEQAVQLLAALLASETDIRAQVGEAGEEHVLGELRNELQLLGHPDLAAAVRRLSLISDGLGYDIEGPLLSGKAVRRIEVKTESVSGLMPNVRFYISRNEYEVGRRHPSEWSLVVCSLDRSTAEISIRGWCRAASLQAYLPADQNGRWTEAAVTLPVSVLTEAYPPAV